MTLQNKPRYKRVIKLEDRHNFYFMTIAFALLELSVSSTHLENDGGMADKLLIYIGYLHDSEALGIGVFLCLIALEISDTVELQSDNLNKNIVELLNERDESIAELLNTQAEDVKELIESGSLYDD
jgi:hypothetical protein